MGTMPPLARVEWGFTGWIGADFEDWSWYPVRSASLCSTGGFGSNRRWALPPRSAKMFSTLACRLHCGTSRRMGRRGGWPHVWSRVIAATKFRSSRSREQVPGSSWFGFRTARSWRFPRRRPRLPPFSHPPGAAVTTPLPVFEVDCMGRKTLYKTRELTTPGKCRWASLLSPGSWLSGPKGVSRAVCVADVVRPPPRAPAMFETQCQCLQARPLRP